VVQFLHGCALWHARESWRDRLCGPAAPDWFALERDARAECVKRGYARTMWRVMLGEQVVFAKVFDVGGFADRFMRHLVGSSAEREWRASREAEARGVPVPCGIALGVHQGRLGREVFVSEGVSGAVNLADAWEQDVASVSSGRRRAAGLPLIDAVAALFATAHERGFVHGDGHPHNILVRAAPDKGFELVFVDVHSARITDGPAPVSRSVESLAQLDQHFRRRVTRPERLRFLRAYLGRRPSLMRYAGQPSGLRELLTSLARSTASGAARLARTRDRRLRGDGKYFCRFVLGDGWQATTALRLERRHVFPESDVPDRGESDWRALLAPLAASRHAALTEAGSIALSGLRIDVMRLESLRARLWATMRGSAHRRPFESCHKLRHRDVASELILGYLEHRHRGLVDVTMLIRPARA
jgi:tRNA A-37 threonylcarbamoyl transferase component Bud32